MRLNTPLRVALALSLLAPAALAAQERAAPYDTTVFRAMQWRNIGPFRGGRVNGVTGVPGQPHTFFFGSVGVLPVI